MQPELAAPPTRPVLWRVAWSEPVGSLEIIFSVHAIAQTAHAAWLIASRNGAPHFSACKVGLCDRDIPDDAIARLM